MGLVAQEVESVMPELVLREADASQPLGLNYMGLLPVLVKAAQEQQAQIKEQAAQLTQQEAEIKRQQNEIESLKRLVCQDHPQAPVCQAK